MEKPKPRCLYGVLGLSVGTDDLNEIKKAYSSDDFFIFFFFPFPSFSFLERAALQYHPDKNTAESDQDMVNQRFLEVQEAWRVLSDPNERKWYDDHREDILRGFDRTEDVGDEDKPVVNPLPNLWYFFNGSCFKGFGNDEVKGIFSLVSLILIFVKYRMVFIRFITERFLLFGNQSHRNAETNLPSVVLVRPSLLGRMLDHFTLFGAIL